MEDRDRERTRQTDRQTEIRKQTNADTHADPHTHTCRPPTHIHADQQTHADPHTHTLSVAEEIMMSKVTFAGIVVVVDAELQNLTLFKEIIDEKLLLKLGIQIVLHRLRSGQLGNKRSLKGDPTGNHYIKT